MTTYAITAAEGFKSLRKDITYFVVRNNSASGPTVLAYFIAERKTVALAFLAPGEFQDGLSCGSLKAVQRPQGKAGYLPPWLSHLKDVDLDKAEAINLPITRHGKKSARNYAEDRLLALHDALERVAEILSSANPDRELNRMARACVPPQNETRFRNYFYTYLACGHNIYSLLPRFKGGTYERTHEKYQGKKFGRHSADGATSGYPMTKEMRDRCLDGFRKYAKVGKTLTSIYERTLTNSFGCSTRDKGKYKQFYHPQGHAFPTETQFRYQCKRYLNPQEWDQARMTAQDFRSKHAPTQGSYSQDLMSLMEDCRTDVSHTSDRPRSYLKGPSMDPLSIAKIVDTTSGMIVGIGFTHGAESKRAYNAALFCAAISKTRFGEIIGYPISDAEWPCEGLPISLISDRGPGANIYKGVIPAGGFTPSQTPQSNATVEAKHDRPRKSKNGPPTYEVSDLRPVQMAIREVEQVIFKNRTAEIGGVRASQEMILQGIATPVEMWKYLDERLQNTAIRMPFEQAVRKFLLPVRFEIVKGRLRLNGLHYDSAAFRGTQLFKSSRSATTIQVAGFVLEISVRKAWIETDRGLVEVDVQAPFHAGKSENLSLAELESLSQRNSKNDREREVSIAAAKAASAQKFEKHTGRNWDGGKTVPGRPARNTRDGQRERNALVE